MDGNMYDYVCMPLAMNERRSGDKVEASSCAHVHMRTLTLLAMPIIIMNSKESHKIIPKSILKSVSTLHINREVIDKHSSSKCTLIELLVDQRKVLLLEDAFEPPQQRRVDDLALAKHVLKAV